MAIDKINPFQQQPALQGINTIPSFTSGRSTGTGQSGQSRNAGIFSGETSGVNTNIAVGDTSYFAAQAGKKPGHGRTLGFA